jgi:membrane fusion protein (multidrug efflux system)
MKGRNIILIVVVLFVILVGYRVVKVAQSKKSTSEELTKFPVEVLTIAPTDYDETMNLSGTIVAENQTEVPAKVPGKIIKYLFEEGAWVEKGQNIVSIDRDEIGVEFKEALVEAPISGWLTRRYFDTGTHVAPGMPLFQIADYHKVKLVVPVAEADIRKAKLGAQVKVSFDAWPDQSFSGTVTRISPTVDYMSRTVKAEVSIPNASLKIRPGMYGRALINVRHHTKSIVVPTSAIIDREAGKQVFVVSNGMASVRMVTVEVDMGEISSIKSGLEFGDKLIIAGQHTVADGSSVEITGGK